MKVQIVSMKDSLQEKIFAVESGMHTFKDKVHEVEENFGKVTNLEEKVKQI